MWFIQPKQDYVAQMPWKHAEEPALMAWQIRTRDYHTLPANILFFIFFIISLGAGSLLFSIGENFISSLSLGGGMFLFLLLIAMSMTHQTAIIVYRLTDKRIEVFSWKPQIDSVKPVMKWTAIGSGVVVLFLVFINPSFLIAAIGPVGIGIAATLMGTSKNYQELVRNELQYELNWQNTKKIYVFRERNIIGLNIHWYNPDIDKVVTTAIRPVFCCKGELDERLEYFKKRLPKIPIVEESFEVYH